LTRRSKFIHIFIVAQVSFDDCCRPFCRKDLAQFFGFHVAACAYLLAEVPSQCSMKSFAAPVVGSLNPIR
jgi:hypothetical protein